jgi:hypothetical protein
MIGEVMLTPEARITSPTAFMVCPYVELLRECDFVSTPLQSLAYPQHINVDVSGNNRVCNYTGTSLW